MANILLIIIDGISVWSLYKISDGMMLYIFINVTTDLISSILHSTFNHNVYQTSATNAEQKFIRMSYEKYDSLSFDSKNKVTAEIFNKKMEKASESIHRIITWGIPTTFMLLNTIFQCVCIFYLKKMLFHLCLIIIVNTVCYLTCIRKKQSFYSSYTRNAREEVDSIHSLITLSLPMFQQKEKSVDYITNLATSIKKIWDKDEDLWNNIMSITKLINRICVVVISLYMRNSVGGFLLMSRTLGGFNSAIASLTSFMNQFNRYNVDFDSYCKLYDDLTYESPPININVPQTINITNVDVQRGNFHVKFSENIKINQGNKILIRGGTGDGKTTFVNALMGKIHGITFDVNSPQNYFHTFVDMYQNIREKLPVVADVRFAVSPDKAKA
jgi:ABC-type multidrug transport system fused ATPase/permease subunit